MDGVWGETQCAETRLQGDSDKTRDEWMNIYLQMKRD